MDFFEQEMRAMFGENRLLCNMKFVGKTMIGALDESKLLKVQFINTAAGGYYNAFLVSVIDKENGVMDTQIMKFSEIIGKYKLRCSSEFISPYIWDERGEPRWYTPVTDAQKAQIAEKVLSYAEMFQDQSNDLSMQFQ